MDGAGEVLELDGAGDRMELFEAAKSLDLVKTGADFGLWSTCEEDNLGLSRLEGVIDRLGFLGPGE